tara:strand:- start:7014 stop:8264 length:1251 start_codon:yes stop_codon:yes gene_type:complete
VARLESGHTPSRKRPEYWGGDVPWIGIKDATENHGRVLEDTLQHTNDLGIANSSARILPRNTVCLSRTASVGYVVVMGKPMATSQDFVNWVCSDDIDYQYLKYVLLSERAAFLRFASGTTHQTIYFPEVKAFHVCLPPLHEQRAIAHILGTLDDKIELNRRRNQTLEAMARALFKDWFVDFGPVRAKMEGREPYLPDDLWKLFPDRLDDEGKPEGWAMVSLDALAALVTTSVSPGKSPETIFEHYSIPAFDAGRMPAMQQAESIKSNKYVVDANAVLVSKLNPQTPRIWLPAVATAHAICSTEFMQFVPHERESRPYLYCLMSSQVMREEVLKHVTGSTGSRQRAQPSQIAKVDILEPPADILEAFNLQAAPILNAVTDYQSESQVLAQLRDTLLPKLLSGELRIADTEKLMEHVQ